MSSGGPTSRAVARGAGELLITFGLVVLLFVLYEVWWTNVRSAADTAAVRQTLVQEWRTEPTPPVAPPTAATPAYGSAFALLYIPRLRDKVWGLPVLQGVGLEVLADGAGHYPTTALPGQVGNFALAAHRATHNEPLRDVDQLVAGDKVYVQENGTWFAYVLDHDQIVAPTDTWVIDPVPGKPTATPTQALITLTTCNPRWASYQRWIWWGHLTATTTRVPAGLSGVA